MPFEQSRATATMEANGGRPAQTAPQNQGQNEGQTRAHTQAQTTAPDAAPLVRARAVPMAFLLSRYPAISHTFLLQEVAGLRACGLQIATASINLPDRPLEALSQAEAQEARSTFYVKQGRVRALFALIAVCGTRPAVALRGLAAVFHLHGLTLRERTQWIFYLAEALLVGRWMQRNACHHLHVHFGGPVASVGMLVSIAWKLPYSLTIHGPEELLNTTAHRLREKLQQASFVFCISDFCRSQLCALTPPATWSKFQVIRLGVDAEQMNPAEKALSERPLTLVCTGRLVAEKGQRILLEALLMLGTRGISVAATLIGSGPEGFSLRRFAAAKHLEDRVEFAGALPHNATLDRVRDADIFVLPSFAEGIPVALMEAMAFRVPCVSTTIAGIPELIESGRDGLLVPPANVQALADAIATLAADAPLRGRLGSAGRERILREYNLPLNHRRLASAFVERLSTRPVRGSRP